MKKIVSLVLIFMANPWVSYASSLKCEYSFSGTPSGNVVLEFDESGMPTDTALVSLFYTPARPLPVTVESPAAGELLRLSLAKGDANNEMMMLIYPKNGSEQKSKLINPSAPPIMRELQGTCL